MIENKKKIIIIHFQALEKYPPGINFLRILGTSINDNIVVYTTNYKYKIIDFPPNVKVIRIGKIDKNANKFLRYLQYLKFNLYALLGILTTKVDKVLYYETISAFPVLIASKLKKISILAHYYEYLSPKNYNEGMFLNKLFHELEQKKYNSYYWISQTNKMRLDLFVKDNPNFKMHNILGLINNYPPKSWGENCIQLKPIQCPVKFVYLGALSLENMYTGNFANWINSLNGRAIWDIYSNNYTDSAYEYIKDLQSPFISFKQEIRYDDLPKILLNYDIGIVFYTGFDENNIYSEANKIFEYYVNGIDTWISTKLLGSKHLCNDGVYPKIKMVDFENLESINLDQFVSRENHVLNKKDFIMENEYQKLIDKIQE